MYESVIVMHKTVPKRLLFQNKISLLEKNSNLEKVRDDEKIAFTISSLLNAMADLSKLAEEYYLKDELHHGGGLRSIAKNNLKNKEKWDKLVDFLKDELIINEKEKKYMILDSKKNNETLVREIGIPIMENWRIQSQRDMLCKISRFVRILSVKNRMMLIRKDILHNITMVGRIVCHICGKVDDHVTSINADGKPCRVRRM